MESRMLEGGRVWDDGGEYVVRNSGRGGYVTQEGRL